MGPHCTGTPPIPVPLTWDLTIKDPLRPPQDTGPNSSGTPAMALPDMFKLLHYRPQRSCDQGYVLTRVILSTRGSSSVHAGILPPPRKETPKEEVTPLPVRPP